jgi:hypothetical protein
MTTTTSRGRHTGNRGGARKPGQASKATQAGRTSPAAKAGDRRRRPGHGVPKTTASRSGGTDRPTSGRTSPAAPGTAPEAAAPASTGSGERVRAALSAAGGQTVEQLATVTGLGKSTVAKALVRLETAGQAARTSGGTGRSRQPDQWNPAPTVGAGAGAGRTRRQSTASPTAPAITGRSAATATPANTATATKAAGKAVGGRAGVGGRPKAGERNLATDTVKLAAGQLTQLVADHFAAHPGTVLTPGEVGRSLGRSAGAVRNAADKLTGEGALRRLDGPPRRYTTTTD